MRGPVAPKDPEKKRPGFYIMREKEIFGMPQEDGSGVQFLYESDGRLISRAKIVGNIQDEEILNLLKTTAGFRCLVHSIGVRVEIENQEEPVEFAFQMYGRHDIYGSGTILKMQLMGNGMEQKLSLDSILWSEDDKEPGQIWFRFLKPGQKAKVSVVLYVKDGFQIPEQEEEEALKLVGEEANAMIARSLLSKGNPFRLKRVMEKANRGEEVTLAFIGGSITQGAGAVPIHEECYAWKTYCAFRERFGNGENIHYRKAGVGGTPSELGMIRFERDVLREQEQPDLIVIEFAVNDEGDETKGICYESLVRKALNLPWNPAVILLFSVFADDWNLQERLSPVGYHYHLPMVSIRDAVSPQFGLTREQGRVISRNQFFYDMFHPSNLGHFIMAKCLEYLFEITEKSMDGEDDSRILQEKQEPVIGCDFQEVQLLDKKNLFQDAHICCGSFLETDRDLQCVEMDFNVIPTPQFPYNWQYKGENFHGEITPFTMEITCKSLILVFKDSGEIHAGKVQIYVDDTHVLTVDPLQNGWTHCNTVILFNEEETKEHRIIIQPAKGEEEKNFTILGFGYVK